MSLHIGNLSSNIRKDDLHRVFRRFGRCTIQVKDKYGFVVYDYPAGAEKALKTLRGKKICGQAITISWSKQQPHKRFAMSGKSYEPLHRSYSVKENVDRRLRSYDQGVKEMDSKNADGEIRTGSSNLVDESISYLPDESKPYAGESSRTFLTDRHGREGARENHLEDDRWEKQVVDPSNEYRLENSVEFDRYDPYHSDGQKEFDEHKGVSPLSGSPSIRKTQERIGSTYNGNSDKSCYLCGDVAHKMNKCPLELKRRMPRSRGELHPSGEAVPLRYQESYRELSISKSHQRFLGPGDSPALQNTPRSRSKESRDKKRNRREYESQHKNHLKRASGPSSSSRSKSPSRSVRVLPQLPMPSKLKSASSKKISPSSSLGSSPSHDSRSKTLKSWSTSKSLSPTSSPLTLEVHRNASSTPNKRQKDSKGSMGNTVGLGHSLDLFEEETQVTSYTGAFRPEKSTLVVENECETKPAVLKQEVLEKDPSVKDNEHSHSAFIDTHAPQLDDDHQVDNLVLKIAKRTSDSQNTEHVVAPVSDTEHVVAPVSDNSLTSSSSNSLRMTSEEVCTILKHYGLQHPEVKEKNLPVEDYFGSARLWPWEIIYYRRLKKGPISVENYSRRIAQNEEFGIVDKYIRGSSGWGELDEAAIL